MATLGTAGHVDHGKSTLVHALTGIDPDRLAEEKARGMTIDLGFAWMTLPDGRAVSIVDVPGHEDFIKNMLAGVGGIDLALLVVAADEGVMPQTREHLAILDVLQVPRAIVALTKADLVDADWLALACEDVAATLAHTSLHAAPIVPVSGVTGAGLTELIASISALLPPTSLPATEVSPRLPIDRVFTITGFGTVVTGTLLDGSLRVGQEVAILPPDLRGRVRGIQQHKAQVTVAHPGTRVALNLAGIDRSQIARGMVVTIPDALIPSILLDVWLECASSAPRSIIHNAHLDFFIGATETPAVVRLLEADALEPGAAGWAQVRLTQPVAVVRGDRFIVRNPSPSETLGGGSVVDPQPRHHRRHQPAITERLAALLGGDAAAIIAVTLARAHGPARLMTTQELATRTCLALATVHTALAAMQTNGTIETVGEWWMAHDPWTKLCEASQALLTEYHAQWPLRAGMPREEWRTRLTINPKQIEAVQMRLLAEGKTTESAINQGARTVQVVKQPTHMPIFTSKQQVARDALLARMHIEPLNPPSSEELATLVDRDLLAALVEQGTLMRLSDDLVMLATTFTASRDAVVAYLHAHERVTVAEVRDLLGATRRIVVPLLETLDAQHITRRLGDVRVLGLHAPPAMPTPPPESPTTVTE